MITDPSVKSALKVHRIDRLMRAKKPPMLIPGVLGQRAIHIWSGMPYAGKTFLALEAMRSVAERAPFLGHEPFTPARAGNVLYLGNDSPDWDVAQQFEKLVGFPLEGDVEAALAETAFGSYGFILDPGFALSTAEDADRLVKAANAFAAERFNTWGRNTHDPDLLQGTSLIVIDTLRSVHGFEQNDNTEMQHLVNLLRYVSTHTGAAILALHHFNKSHPGERDRVTLERIMGAVAITGGVDSVLALVPKDKSIAVRVLKHRVAAEQGDFMYNFVDKPDGSVVLSLTSDAGIVNPPVLASIGQFLEENPGWTKTSRLEEVVQATVPGMDKKKAANAVSNTLRQMEKAGKVARIHGAARLVTEVK